MQRHQARAAGHPALFALQAATVASLGGYSPTTEVVGVYLYLEAFRYDAFGVASATGWIMVLGACRSGVSGCFPAQADVGWLVVAFLRLCLETLEPAALLGDP